MNEKFPPNGLEGLKKVENLGNWIEAFRSSRIRIDSFLDTNGVTEKELDNDLKWERNTKKEFDLKKEKKTLAEVDRDKKAELAEVTVFTGFTKYKWLGDNTKCRPPALYDDYKNKIDLIADLRLKVNQEIEADINPIGFSIDVTIGSNEEGIKVSELKRQIEEGKTLKMKYFETEIKTAGGVEVVREINRALPRVVIYVDPKIVEKIEELMMDESDSGLKNLMSDLRIDVIKQILNQLREYKDYCEQKGITEMEKLYSKSIDSLVNINMSLGISSQVDRLHVRPK